MRTERKNKIILFSTLALFYFLCQVFMRIDPFLDDSVYEMYIRFFNLTAILFPHHLLFHLIKLSMWKPLVSIFPNITVFQVGQQVNLAAGLLAGYFLFNIIFARTRNFWSAYALMLLLLFSHSCWLYLLGSEPYTLALSVMLMFFYYILVVLKEGGGWKEYALAGIMAGLMILVYQMTVLVAFAFIIYIIISLARKRMKIHQGLASWGAMTLPVVGIYITFAGILGNLSSTGKFWKWITPYIHKGFEGGVSIKTLPFSVISMFRAIHYSEKLKDFLLYGSFDWQVAVFFVMSLGIVLGMSYFLIIVIRSWFRKDSWKDSTFILLFSSLFIFSIFLIWWLPLVVEYWQFPLTIFLIVLGDNISGRRYRLKNGLIYCTLFIIIVANFWGEIFLHSRFANPPPTNVELADNMISLGCDERTALFTRADNVSGNVSHLSGYTASLVTLQLGLYSALDDESYDEGLKALESELYGFYERSGEVYVGEEEISIPQAILPNEWLYDRDFIERFMERYGAYLQYTGIIYHIHNRECRLFRFNAEGYFLGSAPPEDDEKS